MALTKISNNSLSAISSLPASIPTGALTLLSTQTASASASIEFTSGIDSTYDSYVFKFINCHPQNDNVDFQVNFSTDGGSNYNVTKTSTFFAAYQNESGSATALTYATDNDLAQSTGYQMLNDGVGNGNDESCAGTLQLFNPSSSVYVKHYIATSHRYYYADYAIVDYVAGYGNTTSPINAVSFKFESGNIDDGIIKLYGVS